MHCASRPGACILQFLGGEGGGRVLCKSTTDNGLPSVAGL